MSSYLHIYGVPKADETQHLNIVSFTSSHQVYQYMDENIPIVSAYHEGQYSTISASNINDVLKDLESDIHDWQVRTSEYERHAAGKMEIIEEIINNKSYIEDLKATYYEILFLRNIVDDAERGFSDFKSICCTIG